jgi:beta-N-acetylhexosaminidase
VVYTQVDARPAGFSGRWLNDILRRELGFQGAVVSDDLSMAGARQVEGRELDYTQAALLALEAGCDLVPLCNQSVETEGGAAIDELLAGLARAQEEGTWSPSAASEQRRLALLPRGAALSWDALMAHPDYMHALDLLP